MHIPPIALTIAGSDSCAGAGLQADLKTFSAFGVHGLTAVTAVVAETPREVTSVHAVPAEVLVEQVRLLLKNYPVAAIKTGMLANVEQIEAVSPLLAQADVPLVVDPILSATTGDDFLGASNVSALRELLLPHATLVTPNGPEAEQLSQDSRDGSTSVVELEAKLGCAVLLTGGHSEKRETVRDVFCCEGIVRVLEADRIAAAGEHGTGCTLTAAITASLAHGKGLSEAIVDGWSFVRRALQTSYGLPARDGRSLGALNQLLWEDEEA